jgi:hypothetical protein
MASRLANASGETSTRKAMFLPELFLRYIQRNALSPLNLIRTTTNSGDGLGPLKAFQHELIALRVLDY